MNRILLILAVSLFVYGSVNEDVLIVSFSQIPLCVSLALFKPKNEYANPIFLFNISMAISSVAHTQAFYIGPNKGESYHFFHYSSEPHFLPAMQVFWLGVLFVTVGYYAVFYIKGLRFPRIESSMPAKTNHLIIIALAIYIGAFGLPLRLPGALSKFVDLFPFFVIFFYTRKMNIENNQRYDWLIHVLIVVTTIKFVFFSYLRSSMIVPIITYFIAHYSSGKTLKYFMSPKFYIYYLGLILFVNYFTFFGESRSNLSIGVDRIDQLIEGKKLRDKEQETMYEEDKKTSNIITRASIINQLSQAVKLTETEGFFDGETIAYYSYAFIPRFLWPEKPIIQQGAWFAHKIGMAIINDYGGYNNSINMTVYGEFYLNFGFWGVIIGCFIFGGLISMLWKTSPIFENHNNYIAAIFALYLLSNGFFQLGADLQFIVTLIAVYLIIYAFSHLMKIIYNK